MKNKLAAYMAEHELKSKVKPISPIETGVVDPETGKPFEIEQQVVERIPYAVEEFEDKPLLDEDAVQDIIDEYPEDVQGNSLGVGDRVNLIGDYSGSSQRVIKNPVLDQDGNPVLDEQGEPMYEINYRLVSEEEGRKLDDFIETGEILGFIIDRDPEEMFLKGGIQEDLIKEFISEIRPDLNLDSLRTRKEFIELINTALTAQEKADLKKSVSDEMKSLDFDVEVPWAVVSVIDPETGEKVIDKKTGEPKILTLVQYNVSKIAKNETLGDYLIRISSATEAIIKRAQSLYLNSYIKLAKINQEEYMLYNQSYNQLELPEEYAEDKNLDSTKVTETEEEALDNEIDNRKAKLFNAITKLSCSNLDSSEEDDAIIEIFSISSDLPEENEYKELINELNLIAEEFLKSAEFKNSKDLKFSDISNLSELLKIADDNTSHPFMPYEVSQEDILPVTDPTDEIDFMQDTSKIDGKRMSSFKKGLEQDNFPTCQDQSFYENILVAKDNEGMTVPDFISEIDTNPETPLPKEWGVGSEGISIDDFIEEELDFKIFYEVWNPYPQQSSYVIQDINNLWYVFPYDDQTLYFILGKFTEEEMLELLNLKHATVADGEDICQSSGFSKSEAIDILNANLPFEKQVNSGKKMSSFKKTEGLVTSLRSDLGYSSFKNLNEFLRYAVEFGNMAEKEELGPTETSNEEVQKPGLDTKE